VGYAAKRLARTEINNAFHAQAIADVQEKPWVEHVTWHLSKMHKPIPGDLCETYDGQQFSTDLVPLKPHPQCVTGDTLVQFPKGRVIAATSRRHIGQLVEIQYASGRNLTITPNHPVLTTTGMIPATMLSESSRVISSFIGVGEVFGADPDPKHGPALAKDVFASFNESIDVMFSVVRSMPEDFHGDSREGDVAVVRSNVQFGDGFWPKTFSEHGVDWIAESLLDEFTFGPYAKLFEGLLPSSTSLISPRGQFNSPGLWNPGSPNLFGFSGSSELDPMPFQELLEGHTFDRKILGPADFIWRSTGQIEIDQVIGIRRFESDMHVYNFQTELGWYTANNTVVKNCMCYTTPDMMPWDQVEANIIAGVYDEYIDGNL